MERNHWFAVLLVKVCFGSGVVFMFFSCFRNSRSYKCPQLRPHPFAMEIPDVELEAANRPIQHQTPSGAVRCALLSVYVSIHLEISAT